MAIESVFTGLAILIWMTLGAACVLLAWWRSDKKRDAQELNNLALLQQQMTSYYDSRYEPYAERLGKPCWKDGKKYRVVAVSHKGAVCIRLWDSEFGNGGKWVPANKVSEQVSFNELAEG